MIEGNAGTVNMPFTVSLSAPSGKVVSVKYQTSASTATSPADFTAIALTTLTFQPGVQSQNVVVAVKGDTLAEGNETFTVNLSSPTNATLSKSQGIEAPASTALIIPAGSTSGTIVVPIIDDPLDEDDEQFTVTLAGSSGATLGTSVATGTIIDDDPQPTISIADIKVSDSGSTPNAIFSVTLSAPSSKPISVSFQTANGTALAGSDYQAQSGTLTIPAGATSTSITVAIITDTVAEPDETFSVNLGSPVNATLGKASGSATISDLPVGAPQPALYLPLLEK